MQRSVGDDQQDNTAFTDIQSRLAGPSGWTKTTIEALAKESSRIFDATPSSSQLSVGQNEQDGLKQFATNLSAWWMGHNSEDPKILSRQLMESNFEPLIPSKSIQAQIENQLSGPTSPISAKRLDIDVTIYTRLLIFQSGLFLIDNIENHPPTTLEVAEADIEEAIQDSRALELYSEKVSALLKSASLDGSLNAITKLTDQSLLGRVDALKTRLYPNQGQVGPHLTQDMVDEGRNLLTQLRNLSLPSPGEAVSAVLDDKIKNKFGLSPPSEMLRHACLCVEPKNRWGGARAP